MKKKSILFVCLGNICRSPAAEALFIDLIKKKGLNDEFTVDSAGTGSWHIGKKADLRMRIAAERRNINILSRARQINTKDFEKFQYILAMDDSNFENINKEHLLIIVHQLKRYKILDKFLRRKRSQTLILAEMKGLIMFLIF